MCIRRFFNWLFPGPAPVPPPDPNPNPLPQPVWTAKIGLFFGTNYDGTPYKLSGCLNDIDDEKKCFETYFTDWVIRIFKSKEVTASLMYNTIKETILAAKPGTLIRIKYSGHGTTTPNKQEADGYDEALFTEQGLLTDDMVSELEAMTPDYVTVKWDLDSCMSGGMQDNLKTMRNGLTGDIVYLRNRFVPNPEVSPTAHAVRKLTEGKAKFVMAAGCLEAQTCADATFSGRANGAYTYYNLKGLREGISFGEEMNRVHAYLPGHGFDQDPILLGDSAKFDFKY